MKSLSFEEAVATLQNFGLLIYPTETFFALGCSALNVQAVAAVYGAKDRDKTTPLPVIIGDISQLEMVTGEIGADEEMLINTFWPGPLTIIMPARSALPTLLTAGTGRVAVRLSSHHEASRLAMAAGFPLVSSSANMSGRPPASRPEELDPEIIRAARGAVYTGGDAPCGGQASTIVELVNAKHEGRMLHILREGAVPVSSLSALGFACYKR